MAHSVIPSIHPGFVLMSSGDLCPANGPIRIVRPEYAKTHQRIESGLQLRATLRAGGFAWPGGYPLYLLFSDGEVCCFDCARKEFPQIARSIRDHARDGWRIVGCDINYEDSSMFCAHCNVRIPSAYGNDEEDMEDMEDMEALEEERRDKAMRRVL